jgi:iron complex outermembrane receptor protein
MRLRGVEFESTLHPTGPLDLYANFAYNDAKYLSYENAPAPIEYTAALTAAGKPAVLSLTGYQIRNAPKWTVQGGFNLDQPIRPKIHFTAYGNLT